MISIVFLFLVHLTFPSNLPTVQVSRNRYGNDNVKLVRQFEKLFYKYRKLLVDLSFHKNCIKNHITPKFLKFWFANRDLLIEKLLKHENY